VAGDAQRPDHGSIGAFTFSGWVRNGVVAMAIDS
jgi:hypothetical protein